jgi:hypothetical protein
VLTLAEVAGRAARKRGLLGRSRTTETDSERDALRYITATLER